MLNPKDIECLENGEDCKELDPALIEEFSNGKGDDEDGSNTEVQ